VLASIPIFEFPNFWRAGLSEPRINDVRLEKLPWVQAWRYGDPLALQGKRNGGVSDRYSAIRY
jgi:hypothetical protein